MRLFLYLGLLVGSALASLAQIRSHDICLQVMLDFPLEAKIFCSIYTIFGKYSIDLPKWIDGCADSSKISSACSKIKTSTSSTKKSTSSSSSSKKTTTTTPCITTTSTTSSKKSSSTSTTVRQTSSSISSSSSKSPVSFTSSSLTSYTMIPTTSISSPSSSSSTFSSTPSVSSSSVPTTSLPESSPSLSLEPTTSSESSTVEITTLSTSTFETTSIVEPPSTTSSEVESSTSSSISSISSTSSTEITSSDSPSSTSSELSSSSVLTSTDSSSTSAPTTTTSDVPTSSSSSTILSSSTTSALGPIRTSPPTGAVVVDQTGAYPGSYIKVGLGVSALNTTTTIPQYLFIFPGTYVEQVYIPLLKSNLTVQGYTTDATSYQLNAATITYNLALLNTTSDDLTATVRQWNTNTKFYNLNIANTFGHVSTNGQNLAISAHTARQGYYGMQFLGYQDTILANTGNQLYAKSLIVGAIDFIFGQTATAWFDSVDIRTIATGSITASGRSAATNPSWYVINNSTVDGIDSTIAAGTNFLGRPWKSFARVVFQNTYLGAIIAPAGWRVWSTAVNGSTNIDNVTFAEWSNYGPGSVLQEGPRANFSFQLDSPIAIETVLGPVWKDEWWVDLSYMSY